MAVNPEITNYGGITYTNNENNWRAEDIEFLQRRSVLRYPSTSALDSSDHNEVGAVAYIAADPNSDDVIEPGADAHFRVKPTASGWKRLVSTDNLRLPVDSGASVVLRHASAVSGGLGLLSSGATEVTTLRTATGGVQITAGTVTVGTQTLSESGGKLVASGTLRANTLESAGAVNSATVTTTGAVTAGNGLTVSGGTLTAGTSQLGITSVETLSATGRVSTDGRFAVNRGDGVSDLRFDGTGIRFFPTGPHTARVILSQTEVELRAANVKVRHDTSETAADVAGVVVSSSPPSGNYPDGTIWIEV